MQMFLSKVRVYAPHFRVYDVRQTVLLKNLSLLGFYTLSNGKMLQMFRRTVVT